MRQLSPSVSIRSFAVLFVALAGAACSGDGTVAPGARIDVDSSVEYQTIEGLGGAATNWTALRNVPEPDRTAVLDLAFRELEPHVVRFNLPNEMEPVNDDDDPEHVNPDGFVRPDDHLWQLDEIAARTDARFMTAIWSPPAFMKTTGRTCCGGSLIAGMEPELAELVSVYLRFLSDAGHPLEWLSLQNEPEAAPPWDGTIYGPERYASTAEVVAERVLRDRHTARLVGPDSALTPLAHFYVPPLLAQPTASRWLTAVAFHMYQRSYYGEDAVGAAVRNLRNAVPAELPIWMTEFSNTTRIGYGSFDEALAQARLLHESLVNGASMYLIWQLYRPDGPGEALIVISPNLGEGGYTVTPKYWTARQYVKFIRPGARRIEASSADPEVRVSAYRNPDGARVAVLLNETDEPRWVTITGEGLAGTPRVVRTSPVENGVELERDSPDRVGRRSIVLPARSVSTAIWPGVAAH